MKGRLFLFPVPIGADDIAWSLPAANAGFLSQCHTFIVEELRTARRFLKRVGYPHAIDDTTFFLLNEHTPQASVASFLEPALQGHDIGLLSEAGLPCVADPGSLAVAAAHRLGIDVVPLVGPSSLMLALMASGFNGQRFAFAGYLPIDRTQRAEAIRSLEQRMLRTGETQLFIEAPYRNNQLLDALLALLSPSTRLCVATDISLPTQAIHTYTAAQWKRHRSATDLHKRNTVFLIGR